MPTSHTFHAAPRRALRILYAEDVPELRELARVIFSRDGHSIECAVDGLTAFEEILAHPKEYDLLITDHHMPRMNGLELVNNLRQIEFTAKIVVFSSELNPDTAAEYNALGVDRILFKPVYPSYLRQAIAELFPVAEPAHA